MAAKSTLAELYTGDRHPLFARRDDAQQLDTETFGKLMVFAWAARNGRSDFPDRDALAKEFLENRKSLPEPASNLMNPEPRAIGQAAIAEYSQYMTAAQDAGLVKRYNPAFVRCHVEVGLLEARDRLDEFRGKYPDVISWLDERVKKLSKA